MAEYPKTLRENLKYRYDLIHKAKNNKTLQEGLREQCRRDALFFFNSFLSTYDPRRPLIKNIPFITYPYQDDVILWDKQCVVDQTDNLAEKSRDLGCTWIFAGNDLHDWLFHKEKIETLWGSWKEEYVDKRGDMKTIFEKFRHALRNLPSWLLPRGFDWQAHDNYMRLLNPDTGSAIAGESANPNFGRGGRFYRVRFDEFAFWEYDCFSRDTEILTDSGWKFVVSVTQNDLVYSMDTKTEVAEMKQVTDLRKVYADELISFKNKSVDIMCTKNHKILIKKRKKPKDKRLFLHGLNVKNRYTQTNGSMYFRRADELMNQKHDFLPLTADYHSEDSPCQIHGFEPNDFMEFLGWFVSEGSSTNKKRYHCLLIAQDMNTNEEKCILIKSLLGRMNIPIRYHGHQFYIGQKSIPKEMYDEFCSLGKAHEKFIPQKYLNLHRDLLLNLFDSLIYGDGCRTLRHGKKDKLTYTTVSKKLADNMQDLCQKIGLRASIHRVKRKNDNWRDQYCLNIGFKKIAHIVNLEVNMVPYKDYAYCVSTPFHTLYMRRNGVACWCGNSDAWKGAADSTKCRTALSTPHGAANKFAKLAKSPSEMIRKLTLHWTQHPVKNQGAYRWEEGRQIPINLAEDKDAAFKAWQEARLDTPPAELIGGTVRSPWYDAECARRNDVKEVAEELDIDYARSGMPFFNLRMLKKQTPWPVVYRQVFDTRIPVGRHILCDLVEIDHKIEARESRMGWLRVFELPVKDGQYVVSGDTAEGLEKGDESFGIVREKWTRNVVAACNGAYDPDDFSFKLKKMGAFYNKSLTAPENNNMGYSVCSDLQKMDCNLYWTKHKNEKTGETTRVKAGFTTTPQSRPAMLAQAQEEVKNLSCEVRDPVIILQMEVFVHNVTTGKPEALGDLLDDGVIAYAIGSLVIQQYPYKPLVKPSADTGELKVTPRQHFRFGSK